MSKISEILWFGLVWKALNPQLLVRDQVLLRIVVKEYIGQQKIFKAFPESGCGLDMINCSPIYPAVNPQYIF